MDEMADYPHDFAKEETPAPPPGIPVSNHYNESYGYLCYRPSGTRDWLIMYTCSGKGIVQNNHQMYTCTEGTLTIIPAGTPHHYYTAKDAAWEKMWCHFIPRPSWHSWISLPTPPNPLIHVQIRDKPTQKRIYNAFQRLIGYNFDEYNPYQQDLALNALEEVIIHIASQNAHSKGDKFDPRVREVLNYLTENYAHSVQLEQLGKMVHLSPSRLAHLFKEQVGEPIIETLLKIRLKQASKLLLFTSKQVNGIALEVGFNSTDYFSRKFTEYYGLNPSMYRKRGTHKERPRTPH